MRDPIEKPVVIVTGASAGIGAAVVRRFFGQGYAVVAVSRGRERLAQLARTLPSAAQVELVAADVTELRAPATVVAAALQAFGRVDCLVNNAGSGKWGRIGDTDDATIDEVLDTSLKAPLRFCRAVLPVMRPGASIINIGSTFGLLGGLGGGVYCAAKAGLVGLTQSIAVDYGAKGIRANLVAPGVIKTEMTQQSWDTQGFQRTNQEMTPLDRDGTVEDVANLVYFLASAEGSYIQGQTIALDGGWTTTKYLSREALRAERVGSPGGSR
jgi:3-oxoacyl-[acyl-carrier protein] reductase